MLVSLARPSRLRLVFALLMLQVVGAAQAKPPPKRPRPIEAEARRHYEAGASHFEAREYQKAILELEAGYKLKPKASVLSKIAEAYALAGLPKLSIDYYKRYLAAFPDAEDGTDILARIAALEKEVPAKPAMIEKIGPADAGVAVPVRPPAAPLPPPVLDAPPVVGTPPRPPPKAPPDGYTPPWLREYPTEFKWGSGHIGYDLNRVKGFWRQNDDFPMDHGLFIGFGPDDRFLLIVNLLVSVRFIAVHDGLEDRGRSFAIDRLVFNVRGNLMTPRLVYMFNVIALTALGSSPFLLDALLAWAIVPRRLSLVVGQFMTDYVVEGGITTVNLAIGLRSLASRFFMVDRSIGARASIGLTKDPERQLTLHLSLFNHTVIQQNLIAFNSFNPDLGFMYGAGLDFNRGPAYGTRDGDFPYSLRSRFRISLRAMYADINSLRLPGMLTLRGRQFLGHLDLGTKYRGFHIKASGFWRLSQFTDLNPDFLDFGVTAQVGVFLVRHLLELTGRYSQIWPDSRFEGGRPRNLPRESLLSPRQDVFDPIIAPARIEAGGGLRLFPTKDPMFNLILAYVWRDVDSTALLQVNGWW